MLKIIFLALLMCFGLGFGNKTTIKTNPEPVLSARTNLNSVESDEFLSYWKDEFRKDDDGNIIAICDISYLSFKDMYARYVLLDDQDKSIVDKTKDYEEGYVIKDSIKTLIDRFADMHTAQNKEKRTLDQSSSIIVIVSIAVFGMSTICVFFVLKNDNVIQ